MSNTDVVPDVLVLAAIERADRHRARDVHAVPVWVILEHLDIARRSAAARQVRGRLDALLAGGRIEFVRLHGAQAWEMTPAGRRYLQRQRRAGEVPELPESPQHRAWRNARTLAEQEIDRFRLELRGCLTDAMRLLDADPPARSDEFYVTADRLKAECWRLASATYCLREWAEPDDAHADIDDRLDARERQLARAEQAQLRSRRAGRHHPHNWERGV
jgi:hypothetical protein